MKVQLTMKVKLLLIFTFLTLFTVGTYLYFALNLFAKDKMASIHEHSLEIVNSLSREFDDYVDNAYEKSLIYSNLAKSGQRIVDEFLSKSSDVISFHILGEAEHLTKTFFNDNLLTEQFDNVNSSIENYKQQNLLELVKPVIPRLSVEKYIVLDSREFFKTPSFALVTKNSEGKYVIIVLSSLGLNQAVKKNGMNNTYLIDSTKETLLTSTGNKIDSTVLDRIWGTKNKLNMEGTLESDDKSGASYLCAFSVHGPTGMTFVTMIKREVAFFAIDSLIKKSIVIAVVIIALSLILSVMVSNKLTKGLMNLVDATKELSNGNYGIRLDVFSSDEVAKLTIAFNTMSYEISELISSKEGVIKQLEKAKLKVETYSQNLAQMVEDRTEKLRQTNDFMDTMLNSLGQGLMVFNKEGIVNEVYTKACDQIFSISPGNHNKITNVLEVRSDDDLKNFTKWTANLFKEPIPFEHLVALGPRFYTNGLDENHPEFKYVTLEYYPMRNEAGGVENIVCVATDISAEYLVKKAYQKQENYTNMITNVILSRGQFEVFVSEFRLILKDIVRRVTGSHADMDFDVLMRHFHTIKGGSSLFSLAEMVEICHKAEDFLAENKHLLEQGDRKFVAELHNRVNSLSRAFKEIIFQLRDYIGESLEDGLKRIEIKYPLLVEYKQMLIRQKQFDLAKSFQDNFLMEPVVRYFKGYNAMLQDISKKLGKEINPIIFEDNGVQVYAEEFNEFFSVMVHLFRNIADHAIEPPADRVAAGKTQKGNVLIRFSKTIFNNKDSLIVQIQDDGKGINASQVRETMQRMGYPDELLSEPDEQVIYHIFDENFSSNETVTDISGRGVGMSAIKTVIERQGGAINLRTVPGKGTSFNFCINGTVLTPKG